MGKHLSDRMLRVYSGDQAGLFPDKFLYLQGRASGEYTIVFRERYIKVDRPLPSFLQRFLPE
jgi:hypothetical protein